MAALGKRECGLDETHADIWQGSRCSYKEERPQASHHPRKPPVPMALTTIKINNIVRLVA